MEALKIDNLCGYLPFGLKCQPKEQSYLLNYPLEIKGVLGETVITSKKSFPFTQDFHISKIKPICFPLSYLTKPITINGETFVPMVELANLSLPKEKFEKVSSNEKGYYCQNDNFRFHFNHLTLSFYIINFNTTEPDFVHWMFSLFQKLFEWKFAINLPEGSWIPVTEEFNPYK